MVYTLGHMLKANAYNSSPCCRLTLLLAESRHRLTLYKSLTVQSSPFRLLILLAMPPPRMMSSRSRGLAVLSKIHQQAVFIRTLLLGGQPRHPGMAEHGLIMRRLL